VEAALAWVPYEKKHEVDACEKGMDGLESHFAVGLPESRFRPRIFRRRSVGPLTPARRLLPAIRGNEARPAVLSSSRRRSLTHTPPSYRNTIMPVPTHTQTTSDTSTGVGHLKLRGHHDAPETSAFPDLDANGVSLYPSSFFSAFSYSRRLTSVRFAVRRDRARHLP